MKKFEGTLHSLENHDNSVTSRMLFNPGTGCDNIDFHVTTFVPGADMDEESHETSDHIFIMISGNLEVLQDGVHAESIYAGDSIFLPAGEGHQLRNPGPHVGVFLAVTVPPSVG